MIPTKSILRTSRAVLASLLILAPAAGWCADSNLLGKIDFPNSGATEAQADFIEGVLYLHNFEYDEATEAFKRAQAIDPDFAMAYWGEAMTYNHPLWNRQSRRIAREGLRGLGRTAEQRAAKAPTQREKDYLWAIETLYGNTEASRELPKHGRDLLYRDAMRRLSEANPEDREAMTFHGLSILGAGAENRDFATYMQAAAVLTSVWDASRQHPGAAHYLIHSYDDPIHAPLGLPMARAYSRIAPGAAHAQHMVSHIFIALGMWDDLVTANEIAIDVEFKQGEAEGERQITASHYVYWLQSGYLQQGRVKDAQELMRPARSHLSGEAAGRESSYYGTMFARYLFDTEDWESADDWTAPEGVAIPSANYHFARAFAAIKTGDLDAAREHAKVMNGTVGRLSESILDETSVGVLNSELEALFALAAGESEKAASHAREAVAGEAAMPPASGPPQIAKPAFELLGDVLLELGQPEGAAAAYRDQLARTPRRSNSLLGLARAAKAGGDAAIAADAYSQLNSLWSNADPSFGGLAKIREATGAE